MVSLWRVGRLGLLPVKAMHYESEVTETYVATGEILSVDAMSEAVLICTKSEGTASMSPTHMSYT